MAKTVKVPGLGELDSRLVYGTLAAAGVFVGWMYWRSRGSSASSADAPVYDPDAVGVSEYAPAPSGNSTVDVPAADDGIDTDAEWTNAVVEALSSLGGWDASAVALACGRYLGRQSMSSTDVEIIRTARAMVGEAPSGPHPLSATADDPATGSPVAPGKPRNLRVTNRGRNVIGLDWEAPADTSAPVGGYNVKMTRGPGQGQVIKTDGTNASWFGLKANTPYSFTVEAFDPTDKIASGYVTPVNTSTTK
jgi:hypothetical protein